MSTKLRYECRYTLRDNKWVITIRMKLPCTVLSDILHHVKSIQCLLTSHLPSVSINTFKEYFVITIQNLPVVLSFSYPQFTACFPCFLSLATSKQFWIVRLHSTFIFIFANKYKFCSSDNFSSFCSIINSVHEEVSFLCRW